jgi:hypothetical protein
MKSKTCICKEDFRMEGTNIAWNIPFIKSNNYFYKTKTTKGTKMFFVTDDERNNPLEGVPFIEKKFHQIFDITHYIRHDKINQILND